MVLSIVFFNDTATTEIYTLSLHDALPISMAHSRPFSYRGSGRPSCRARAASTPAPDVPGGTRTHVVDVPRAGERSEEHTSELQSRQYLVCRLLLEKKIHP